MKFGSIWSSINKIGPFALIVGYLAMYMANKSNGIAQIIPDIQALTITKLQTNWQNIALAIAGAVALMFIHKIHLPASMKAVLVVALYAFIGWQIAEAIDPPTGTAGTGTYSPPVNYNPYFTQIAGV